MVVVECRGCEPEDGSLAGTEFTATASSGEELAGELDEEGCWADVDEGSGEGGGVIVSWSKSWRMIV